MENGKKFSKFQIAFMASKLVTVLPLVALYFLDVISTPAFAITKFVLIGLFGAVTIFMLVKNIRAKGSYYKEIILLCQLSLIVSLLAVYFAGVIDTRLFGILKIVMVAIIVTASIVPPIVVKYIEHRKSRAEEVVVETEKVDE